MPLPPYPPTSQYCFIPCEGEYGAILSPQGEANTKQGRSPVRNMQNVAADSANPEATTAKAKAKVKIKFSGMQTS